MDRRGNLSSLLSFPISRSLRSIIFSRALDSTATTDEEANGCARRWFSDFIWIHSNHLYAIEENIYDSLIFLSLPSSSGIITAYHRYLDNTPISGARIDTSSQNAKETPL